MTWTRTSDVTMECEPWLIRKGGWLGGTVYRLFRGHVLICPTAAKAMQVAEARP